MKDAFARHVAPPPEREPFATIEYRRLFTEPPRRWLSEVRHYPSPEVDSLCSPASIYACRTDRLRTDRLLVAGVDPEDVKLLNCVNSKAVVGTWLNLSLGS